MNPIDLTFARLRQERRTAFIPFVTVGDPSLDATVDILLALQDGGASMIELGIPYSDPLADGPVIQRSSQRALAGNVTLADAAACAALAKERGLTVPLLLFTYYNPVLQTGLDAAFGMMRDHGISGIIIPDLPFEESGQAQAVSESYGIHLIPLAALTSKERVQQIAERAKGFIYCVSSIGVTGMRFELHTELESFVQLVKQTGGLPAAVGFGISRPEQYEAVSRYADGVIVGSAIVDAIERQGDAWLHPASRKEALANVKDFVLRLTGAAK